MSKTIEFGAFLTGTPTHNRLASAQATARSLGVSLSADGSRFAGQGSQGDPVKVTVAVPAGTQVTPAVVARGRDALDALLSNGERLSDYALVKDNGVLTQVISLLTGEVKAVQQEARPAPAQAPRQAPAPRRWSPFRRS